MKRRLDQLLVERGMAATRAKAQALVNDGRVFAGERRLEKSGQLVAADAALAVRDAEDYVSRGGVKLAAALDHFAIDPKGLTALDVGASTGGFTDVLLRRGAARVHAVDVGHGQMAASLRGDGRVVLHERLNVKDLDASKIADVIEIIVCDVSFIGLEKALPAAVALAVPGAYLVALIKPQFEVGKAHVGKGGIVRDAALQGEACERIAAWLNGLPGWKTLGLIESPLTGGDGNREFLIAAQFDK